MPFVETRLISPTTLTTSASSALYTVPTGYSAIIKQLVVTNITGTAATFTFYIGAASAGNALFSGTSVAANDTVIINLSQVLTTGETLRALASTGSALNLTVSGVLNDGPLASTATYIADNAITSAKIADGAIVNADINASAAIDQSKIASLTSDLALKAPLASPTFTGTLNASSALLIDGSGRVTEPLQPMFYATGTNGNFTSGTLPYGATSRNVGNHYNTTTSTFTAPVAGVYLFTAQFWAAPGTAGAVSFTVAGRGKVVGRESSESYYEAYCAAEVAYMTAGQTALITIFVGTIHLNVNQSFFSGVLLS
jgi:hypothetical protein